MEAGLRHLRDEQTRRIAVGYLCLFGGAASNSATLHVTQSECLSIRLCAWRYVCLSGSLSVCMCGCPSARPSNPPFVCLSSCLTVCLSVCPRGFLPVSSCLSRAYRHGCSGVGPPRHRSREAARRAPRKAKTAIVRRGGHTPREPRFVRDAMIAQLLGLQGRSEEEKAGPPRGMRQPTQRSRRWHPPCF